MKIQKRAKRLLSIGVLLLAAVAGCDKNESDSPNPQNNVPGQSDNPTGQQSDALVLTSTSRPKVSSSGGDKVRLQGQGFAPGLTVRIGNLVATEVSILSPTEIEVTIPASTGSHGLVDVTITGLDGQTVTRSDLLSYFWGTLKFDSKLVFTGDVTTSAMTLGDLDRDNKLDLTVVGKLSSSLGIFLGKDQDSNGVFKLTSLLDLIFGFNNPSSLIQADLDGDGKLDIVMASFNRDRISVAYGNGDGTFLAPIHLSVDNGPSDVLATDLNGDGKLDLVVANKLSATVCVFLNTGSRFQSSQVATKISLGIAKGAIRLATGDVNGDGAIDIVIANNLSRHVCVLLGKLNTLTGKGDGTFLPVRLLDLAADVTGSVGVSLADLNADGKLDIVVGNTSGHLCIVLGNGDGSFQVPTNLSVQASINAVITADLNDDGCPDIIISTDDKVKVLLGNGDGSFQVGQVLAQLDVHGGLHSLWVTDFDLDGKLDIVLGRLGLVVGLNLLPGDCTTMHGGPM